MISVSLPWFHRLISWYAPAHSLSRKSLNRLVILSALLSVVSSSSGPPPSLQKENQSLTCSFHFDCRNNESEWRRLILIPVGLVRSKFIFL